jgi:hypothetical protein
MQPRCPAGFADAPPAVEDGDFFQVMVVFTMNGNGLP